MSIERMRFIPELREHIIKNLVNQGIDKEIVEHSLNKWETGANPSTPYESGCFEVFKQIQANVNK
jgi:hypothetical protein